MLHTTYGIVLKTIKYAETSVITKVYTEAFGVQSYIVNGVRSTKSKNNKAGLLQPLTLLDMVVYYKEGRDLHRISEMKNAFIFTAIPFEVVKRSIGIFMVEIMSKSIREEESNPDQFEFLWNAVQLLDQTPG